MEATLLQPFPKERRASRATAAGPPSPRSAEPRQRPQVRPGQPSRSTPGRGTPQRPCAAGEPGGGREEGPGRRGGSAGRLVPGGKFEGRQAAGRRHGGAGRPGGGQPALIGGGTGMEGERGPGGPSESGPSEAFAQLWADVMGILVSAAPPRVPAAPAAPGPRLAAAPLRSARSESCAALRAARVALRGKPRVERRSRSRRAPCSRRAPSGAARSMGPLCPVRLRPRGSRAVRAAGRSLLRAGSECGARVRSKTSADVLEVLLLVAFQRCGATGTESCLSASRANVLSRCASLSALNDQPMGLKGAKRNPAWKTAVECNRW